MEEKNRNSSTILAYDNDTDTNLVEENSSAIIE